MAARVVVTDGMEPAQMALCTAAGVALLPLGEAVVGLARAHSPLELLAEPSVMGLAEQALGQAAIAQTRAQRLAGAVRSPWNLAQFEFSPSRSGRAAKRLGSVWARLRHDPQWRPVRWGLLAVLLVQVVALNAVAHRHTAQLDAKRSAIDTLLSQTFPQVPVIVDAPVQMQREVQALARTRGVGAADGPDLARLLSAASEVLGGARPVSAVDYVAGELRLRVAGLLEADADNLAAALGDPAWTVRLQGDQLVLQARGAN
jgi:general secretion pathway protein L